MGTATPLNMARMALPSLALVGGVVGLAAARVPASTEEFRYAVAQRGCTQEDAPAMEIYLTEALFSGEGTPSGPYIRVEMAWASWQMVHQRASGPGPAVARRHGPEAAPRSRRTAFATSTSRNGSPDMLS
jgi:hypothetical protein